MKIIKCLYIMLIITSLLMGVTGCMFENENDTTRDVLEYLASRYGEKFEIENFEKGSTLFPDMYGSDQWLVHPVGSKQLPFYVFKNTGTKGFNDNYIVSNLDIQLTERYRKDIEVLDSRDKAVKLAFRLSDRPISPEYLKNSFEYLNGDTSYEGNIDIYVAINAGNEQNIKNDSEFLYSLYTFMKSITKRDFEISVGYIKGSNFKDAEELIRIAHTINFSWTVLEDGVIDDIYFDSSEDIKGPSHFDTIFE